MVYGNITDWRAYALDRGDSAPTDATDADAGAALQRASDYIRTRYVLRLSPAFESTSPEVIEATYIAAGMEVTTPGFWSTTFTPSQVKVLTKVEGIQWSVVGSKSAVGADAMLPMSPAIDALFMASSDYRAPAMFVV